MSDPTHFMLLVYTRRCEYRSRRLRAFGRDSGITQRFDLRPELLPAFSFVRREVGGFRRSDALKVLVLEPLPKEFLNELSVGCDELRQAGQIGGKQAEGLFLGMSLVPSCGTGGGSPCRPHEFAAAFAPVAELKPRIVGPQRESPEGIDDLPNGLGGMAQSDQAHRVVEDRSGLIPAEPESGFLERRDRPLFIVILRQVDPHRLVRKGRIGVERDRFEVGRHRQVVCPKVRVAGAEKYVKQRALGPEHACRGDVSQGLLRCLRLDLAASLEQVDVQPGIERVAVGGGAKVQPDRPGTPRVAVRSRLTAPTRLAGNARPSGDAAKATNPATSLRSSWSCQRA